CKYGIHDISRTEVTSASGLPRFNMPLELGVVFRSRDNRVENPFDYLILPGVRGLLGVIVDDHSVFFRLLGRLALLPLPNAHRDDKGDNGATNTDGVRGIQNPLLTDFPPVRFTKRVLFLWGNLNDQVFAWVCVIECPKIIIAANITGM